MKSVKEDEYSAFRADLSYKYILLQYGYLMEQYLKEIQVLNDTLRQIKVEMQLLRQDCDNVMFR